MLRGLFTVVWLKLLSERWWNGVSHCDLSFNMPSRTNYHDMWNTKKRGSSWTQLTVGEWGEILGNVGFVIMRSCMTSYKGQPTTFESKSLELLDILGSKRPWRYSLPQRYDGETLPGRFDGARPRRTGMVPPGGLQQLQLSTLKIELEEHANILHLFPSIFKT